jgi:hypothetical protein
MPFDDQQYLQVAEDDESAWWQIAALDKGLDFRISHRCFFELDG